MKLITETIQDVKYVTEAAEDGKKSLFIVGVYGCRRTKPQR